jgi:hypothetical protein
MICGNSSICIETLIKKHAQCFWQLQGVKAQKCLETAEKDRKGMLTDRKGMLKDKKGLLKDKKGVLKDKKGVLKDRKELLKDRKGMLKDRKGMLKDKKGILKDRKGMLKERIKRQRNKLGVREQNLWGVFVLKGQKVTSAHCPLSSIYSRVQWFLIACVNMICGNSSVE